jgi:hypothetical protein
MLDEADLRRLADSSGDRLEFWASLINHAGLEVAAEVGVYRGDFAARVLRDCAAVRRYYMVDPWRHLEGWNKPANKSDDVFEGYLQEVLDKTAPYEEKRVVLRGRTVEVSDRVADGELDFVYIDGDHTLRGITTDLVRWYAKVREGGVIGGDDFCRSIFQHSQKFEPTLVFPFAVYFAEAVGATVYALPHRQFLLQKRTGGTYSFVDLTGRYQNTTLKAQLAQLTRRDRQPEAPAVSAAPSHPGSVLARGRHGVAALARRVRRR